MSGPCDTCCRMHRGPRCKPEDARSDNFSFRLPAHIARELRERVFWGERSAFIAGAVEKRLAEMEDSA